MALVNCPECEKQISNKALICPNCGYKLKVNNSLGKGCLLVSISVILLTLIILLITPYSNKNIEDTVITQKEWRKANNELMAISKILVKNKIRGCGEFFISEITNNEFALACTSDGINWTYYVIYPTADKIFLANEKMQFEPPY